MIGSRNPGATFRAVVPEGTIGERIGWLAELSGCPPPQGPTLLAEMAGDPVAAIGILDGHAVSDPARSTFALRMRLRLLRLQLRLVIAIHGL
jgi:hypothetical protein